MSRPLLEMAPDVNALLDLIDETDGELTEQTEKALEGWWAEIGEERDAKLDSYGALIRTLELRASVRKAEQERLARRVQADTNTVKRLTERLKLFLEVTKTKKVQTQRYQISLCGNGGKLPMRMDCTPEELPPFFQRTVIEADTDKILEALATNAEIALWREKATQASTQGLPIPERPAGVEVLLPCKLLPRGTHVRIS